MKQPVVRQDYAETFIQTDQLCLCDDAIFFGESKRQDNFQFTSRQSLEWTTAAIEGFEDDTWRTR